MNPDVFISYSNRDFSTAASICGALEKAGISCWIAPRNIDPGTVWSSSIADALANCRAVALIFTQSSCASHEVHREVQLAFQSGKTVLPVRLEDVSLSGLLKYYLSSVQWLDVTKASEDNLPALVVSAFGSVLATSQPVSEATSDLPVVIAPDPAPKQQVEEAPQRLPIDAAASADSTLTFLFTDIEGSTQLWDTEPDRTDPALRRHFEIIEAAVACHSGTVFKTVGDGVCASFVTARSAVSAAVEAQYLLLAEQWPTSRPIRVRMGIHSGAASFYRGDYYGTTLNRVARLMSAGHGGQILLSSSAHELASDHPIPGTKFEDLGVHRLRDLDREEGIYQVVHQGVPSGFPPLRTLNEVKNNLPVQLTALIGRESELAIVAQKVRRYRLVTMTGVLGAGKTRLALHVAADLAIDFPDGVWYVDLASVSSGDGVIQEIARTVGVADIPGRSLSDSLIEHLRRRSTLLLLDNCEHVVDQTAGLVDLLLRSCGELRVLATSRELLRTAGENIYVVPPLSFPGMPVGPSRKAVARIVGDIRLEELRRIESIRLFIDRAGAVSPNFVFSANNAEAVASVCSQLEGIPLGLELAAARVRVLPVEQIAKRLNDRFRLLTGGPRTAAHRHETLKAAIDWSYDLLPDNQRSLLKKLSIFCGGATLDGVEAICSFDEIRPDEIIDLLEGLIDKSLLSVVDTAISVRYRLLETLRQYASELLTGLPELPVLKIRHFQYYLSFVKEAEQQLTGPNQGDWLRRLDEEYSNILSAIESSRQPPLMEANCSGLEIASSLWRYWRGRGYVSEGRRTIEGALEMEPNAPPPMLGKAYYGTAVLAYDQCDYHAAMSFGEKALAIARDLGDDLSLGQSLTVLGNTAMRIGELDMALVYLEESLDLAKSGRNKRRMAVAMANLGNVELQTGEYDAAQRRYRDAHAVYKEIGDLSGIANALMDSASVSLEQGDYHEALVQSEHSRFIYRDLSDPLGEAYALTTSARAQLRSLSSGSTDSNFGRVYESLKECVSLMGDVQDRTLAVDILELFAQAYAGEGRSRDALDLIATTTAERNKTSSRPSTAEKIRLDELLASLRSRLGDAEADQVWAAGSLKSIEDAVAAV